MSSLHARHFLFPVLYAAMTAAVIWYFIPGGPAPGDISAPVAAGPLAPSPGISPAATDVPHLFNPPGPVSPGGDEPLQIASMERSDPDLFWKNVEDTLALSMREKLPGARLSDRETRELIENIRAMRESFAGMRQLRRTPENAADIMALADRLDESSRMIREVTGMSTAEFFNRITTEGIDNDKPEKGDVVLEYLDSPSR